MRSSLSTAAVVFFTTVFSAHAQDARAKEGVVPRAPCQISPNARFAFKLNQVPIHLAARTVSQMICKRIVFPVASRDREISTDILEQAEPIAANEIERIFAACVRTRALRVTSTEDELRIENSKYELQ